MLRKALHLTALSSFAVAQQYFEPLADGADEFVKVGATGVDVLIFALVLLLVPPAVLTALVALAGLAGERPRDALQAAFVGGFAALIAWQALVDSGRTEDAPGVVLVAAASGAIAALAYVRLELVRSWLTVLSPVPLVVLALFVVFSPLDALVFGGQGDEPVEATSEAPVVMVVLDELPVTSLLGADMRIDSGRFPGFGQLARDSTWYRNAASVADYTQQAVPALLTGRRAGRDRLQVAADYPRSLFTLLGLSHHMDVAEFATHLCGEAACPEQQRPPLDFRLRRIFTTSISTIPALPHALRRRLADVLAPGPPPAPASAPTGSSVRRQSPAPQPARFEAWLRTLRPGPRPALSFLHLLLPHRPWTRLPSGRAYVSRRRYTPNLYGKMPRDEWAATLALQRHLLQTQYVDGLLQRLLRRLEETGIYDRALVVIAADHGAAFRPGDEMRTVTETNVQEIAPVPLFVKAPGQRAGRVEDSWVQSVDVLPTVAAELGADLPWQVEGVPAAERGRRGHELVVDRQKGGGQVRIARTELLARTRAVVRRNVELIPPGPGWPLRVGPRAEIVGATAARLRAGGADPVDVALDQAGALANVDPDGPVVPAEISGTLRAGEPRRRPVAVAVNGRVAATTWTFAGDGDEYFLAMVPETALRRGENQVEVLSLERLRRGRAVVHERG